MSDEERRPPASRQEAESTRRAGDRKSTRKRQVEALARGELQRKRLPWDRQHIDGVPEPR